MRKVREPEHIESYKRTGCNHRVHQPVVLTTGEVVAHLCADCLCRLPLMWPGRYAK